MNNLVSFFTLSICFICICRSNALRDFDENTSVILKSVHNAEGRGRKTGHYFLYPYHGWHALSWIYWIKVKLIVIAFFVGTAFIWAIQYIGKFYNHCPSTENIHYGHYRSMNDPTMDRFLQNLPKHGAFN